MVRHHAFLSLARESSLLAFSQLVQIQLLGITAEWADDDHQGSNREEQ
jgi:hypothetical protein